MGTLYCVYSFVCDDVCKMRVVGIWGWRGFCQISSHVVHFILLEIVALNLIITIDKTFRTRNKRVRPQEKTAAEYGFETVRFSLKTEKKYLIISKKILLYIVTIVAVDHSDSGRAPMKDDDQTRIFFSKTIEVKVKILFVYGVYYTPYTSHVVVYNGHFILILIFFHTSV